MAFEEEEFIEEEEVRESEEEEVAEYRIKGALSASIPPSIVLSVTYDGAEGKALVKLYDPQSDTVYYWYDNTRHRPYLITDVPPEVIAEKYPDVLKHPGFSHLEVVSKYDALADRTVQLTKVYAKDPLSIGGGRRSIRELLPKTWESRIKYHHSYLFDRAILPGMWYRSEGNGLVPVEVDIPQDVLKSLTTVFSSDDEREEAANWIPLFQAPIPHIKRVAIDIEVFTPQENKVPNPKDALYEVVSVALVGTDGLRRVLLLKRPDVKVDFDALKDAEYEVLFFDNEYDLIAEVFKTLVQYPLIVSFNGDNFDLPYLYNRALALGFKKEEIPIVARRDYVTVAPGIHIDLYKFFAIKAIEVYAFGGVYRGERGLDAIASAVLGIGKIERQSVISSLPLDELAEYNFRDAFITLYFTVYNDELVMKLVILLSRIAKLPPEDLTRSQVSAWIRNMLYFEHRRRGWLIPNKEDIIASRGEAYTKAIIKGKKYAGAVVLDPPAGVFFNVYVLDFASLYPSVISKWNLSYETVNCKDKENAERPIAELPHWICKKRRGITSLLVGILRDLRVHVYKKLAKSASTQQERTLYDVVQSAMKVFINASYGVFGAETFPLYCPPVAELTTALARYVMTSTVLRAIELGMEPIYGDTDSLFLLNADNEKIKGLMDYASQLGIDIDLDKVYRFVLFSGRKKNYLGVTADGGVVIKGLVGKKRNAPSFVKDLMDDIVERLRSVHTLDDILKTRDEISALIRDYESKLRERKITLDKLAIKTTLNKDLDEYTKNKPQHVKAAEMLSKAMGIKLGRGDVIIYVKTRDALGVKPIQLARIDEIDDRKYLEYMATTVEQVLEALGYSMEELRGVAKLLA
ncbi:DNA-directed DNA polymerase I [Thermoproteus tenax]|uniref:DNA polymerase n=1 Tax=Thermoproteus tenax (strain ATCC 35583 / DSM 2078 / JCM 9277 / NBRC 100435 / Kra 1) TaxID=768679 RepID=G4RML5_THETK|nr:DNA-directed DNA polymerase I [Thermoproteus tenax]CCC80846.1 polB DNA-directed DNA polymerase I (B1) [Thermoproteus tenax Kra 1]